LVRQLSDLPDLFLRPSGVQTSASVSQHPAAAAAFIATLMIEQSGFVNYSQTNVGHFPARSGWLDSRVVSALDSRGAEGRNFPEFRKKFQGGVPIFCRYTLIFLKHSMGLVEKFKKCLHSKTD